jgi:uncharacterized protein
MKNLCIIFDCHHPKHYLTLRQLGRRCIENGIDVIWTARNKDVLVDLIRKSGQRLHVLTNSKKGLLRLFGELIVYDLKLMKIVRRYHPQVLMGNSISITHVGNIMRIPSILINDDDAKANPQYPYLGYPLATRIITPECINENYGPRHRKYAGFHELAYLHPDVFTPDPLIREELNVAPNERFFLVRSVALTASHDFGAKGLPQGLIKGIIRILSEKGRVFISSESELAEEFKAYRLPTPAFRIHDVLAACDMLIGDSQTMAAEAAVLGTPSIRMNSFVNRISYLNELEHRYGLTYGFKPDQVDQMQVKIKALLAMDNLKEIWAEKRNRMLMERVDPTDVFWDELRQFL